LDKHQPLEIALKKFSTMGSALTFPVQSIVFSILAIASVLYVREQRPGKKTIHDTGVLVFGDDIVIPSDSVKALRECLGHLYLKVNHNKTFETGKFRESCGIDAYDGVDVTPVRLKSIPDVTRPASLISSVDMINLLKKKGYHSTAYEIEQTIPGYILRDIPRVPSGSGAWGIHDDFNIGTKAKRFNRLLQRCEYRCLSLVTKVRRRAPDKNWGLLQYFTEVCKPPLSKEERLGVANRPSLSLKRRWVAEQDLIACPC
jgi:hypothetical protein